MSLENEKLLIIQEIAFVKKLFLATVNLIPSFDITNPKILPYGLRPHTRSISWIAEQVITQQTKFNAKKLGIDDLDFNLPDTSLHDCIIEKDGMKYFVNVKMHKAIGRRNKNDISAVEKLFMQYSSKQDYRLIYACFGIKFDNLTLSFDKESVHVFSPQFISPIYVNPRNDKIQSYYEHLVEYRTREDFLKLLQEKSTSIMLG